MLFERVGLSGKGITVELNLSEIHSIDSKNNGIKTFRGKRLFSVNLPLYQKLKPSEFPLLLESPGVDLAKLQFLFQHNKY